MKRKSLTLYIYFFQTRYPLHFYTNTGFLSMAEPRQLGNQHTHFFSLVILPFLTFFCVEQNLQKLQKHFHSTPHYSFTIIKQFLFPKIYSPILQWRLKFPLAQQLQAEGRRLVQVPFVPARWRSRAQPNKCTCGAVVNWTKDGNRLVGLHYLTVYYSLPFCVHQKPLAVESIYSYRQYGLVCVEKRRLRSFYYAPAHFPTSA